MKHLTWIIIWIFPLMAIGQNTDAQAYHDKIIEETRQVSVALNNFNSSLETDSALLMHSARATLRKQLDSSLVHLKNMQAYQGNDDWHKSVLLQMQFYRDCVDKEYIKFIDYSLRLSSLNEDEIMDFTKMLSKLNEKDFDLTQLVNQAYKEFVDKYKVNPAKK